jgi:hypothetical protein
VQYAPILADGSLGAWAATTPLPAPAEGLAAAASDGSEATGAFYYRQADAGVATLSAAAIGYSPGYETVAINAPAPPPAAYPVGCSGGCSAGDGGAAGMRWLCILLLSAAWTRRNGSSPRCRTRT